MLSYTVTYVGTFTHLKWHEHLKYATLGITTCLLLWTEIGAVKMSSLEAVIPVQISNEVIPNGGCKKDIFSIGHMANWNCLLTQGEWMEFVGIHKTFPFSLHEQIIPGVGWAYVLKYRERTVKFSCLSTMKSFGTCGLC